VNKFITYYDVHRLLTGYSQNNVNKFVLLVEKRMKVSREGPMGRKRKNRLPGKPEPGRIGFAKTPAGQPGLGRVGRWLAGERKNRPWAWRTGGLARLCSTTSTATN
jgi:hypothetical protein